MQRRLFLSLFAGGVIASSGAFAQVELEEVIERLSLGAYDRIEVSRTFLGRTRIMAFGAAGTREIVLNPSTGIILRDYLRKDDHIPDGSEDRTERRYPSRPRPHGGPPPSSDFPSRPGNGGAPPPGR